jgi:hypothetical protein
MAEEARARPGLKMQTPHELRMTAVHSRNDCERWAALFAINAWKPTK